MTKVKYPIDDETFEPTPRCRRCRVRGELLVRTQTNDYGFLYRTHNRIDRCINPECLRYLETIPEGWIVDNEQAFTVAVRHHRELLDSGRWKGTYCQPYVKDQTYGEAELEAAGDRIRRLQETRTRSIHGRGKGARIGAVAFTKRRNDGETPHDVEEAKGPNADIHSLV